MNRKQVGSSLRRGVAAGTLAGFFAGWMSFTAHSKQLDVVEAQADQTVREHEANLVLPPVPGMPKLAPLPATTRYGVTSGPDMPKVNAPAGFQVAPAPVVPAAQAPQQQVAQPPAVAPAPVPTFAPLPALPPAPKPAPTTKPSGV
jgi:hypothetical protein